MHHNATRAGVLSRSIRGHTVLTITGELDIATAITLEDRITALLDDAAAPVIIDLSGVPFCDASGLRMLVDLRRRAEARGRALSLAGLRPNVSKLLRITSLHRTFVVYPTITEALLGQMHAYRHVAV